jgi:hypothetical protein
VTAAEEFLLCGDWHTAEDLVQTGVGAVLRYSVTTGQSGHLKLRE